MYSSNHKDISYKLVKSHKCERKDCERELPKYWENNPQDSTWQLLPNCLYNDFVDDETQDYWHFVDPLADSSYSLSDGNIDIEVPMGDHDPYNTFKAPRYITNVDLWDFDPNIFEVEIKTTSIMNQQYQIQGIAIEDDLDTYIRFEAYHDGNNTHIYMQPTLNGVHQSSVNITPFGSGPSSSPLWLRVNRNGNTWILKYSTDGYTFSSTTPIIFALDLKRIGVYAGNAVGSGSPAHTATFEYINDITCINGTELQFYNTDKTWLEILQTDSNEYYIKLAKQYIAAILNILNGADDADISDDLVDIEEFFEQSKWRLSNCQDIYWIKILKDFNKCKSYYCY